MDRNDIDIRKERFYGEYTRSFYLGDLDKKETSSKKLNFELFVDEESSTSDVVIATSNLFRSFSFIMLYN